MTDKQPTKTQIKKVLEWCGWKEVQEKRLINEGSAEEFVEDSHWEDPEGGQWSIDKEPDLNNLFEYAVPKLLSKKWKPPQLRE